MTTPMGQRAEGCYVCSHRWHYLCGEEILYDVTVASPSATRWTNTPKWWPFFHHRIEVWKRQVGIASPVIIHE